MTCVLDIGRLPDDIRHPFRGTHIESATDVGNLALGLYSVLWAYDGWSAAV